MVAYEPVEFDADDFGLSLAEYVEWNHLGSAAGEHIEHRTDGPPQEKDALQGSDAHGVAERAWRVGSDVYVALRVVVDDLVSRLAGGVS